MDIVVSIYWLLILRRHFACAMRGPVAFGDSGYVASHRHEVTGDADQATHHVSCAEEWPATYGDMITRDVTHNELNAGSSKISINPK